MWRLQATFTALVFAISSLPATVAPAGASKAVMEVCLEQYFEDKSPSLSIDQTEAQELIQKVATLSGVRKAVFVLDCSSISKAEAAIFETTGSIPAGNYVVYNSRWTQEVIGKDTVQAHAIFGHEFGHFINEHFTARAGIDDKLKEEEADYYAGCVVARIGGSWDSLESLLARLRDEPGSSQERKDYPNRLESTAQAREGYDACKGVVQAVTLESLDLSVQPSPTLVRFKAGSVDVGEFDVTDYQNGAAITSSDVVYGDNIVAIRLGWKKDMVLFSAFRVSDRNVCAKHLAVAIRDGEDINIRYLGTDGGRKLFGIRFGRENDLYNVYGIRATDFEFVFDPSAPRTGETRNATTVIHKGEFEAHGLSDVSCVEVPGLSPIALDEDEIPSSKISKNIEVLLHPETADDMNAAIASLIPAIRSAPDILMDVLYRALDLQTSALTSTQSDSPFPCEGAIRLLDRLIAVRFPFGIEENRALLEQVFELDSCRRSGSISLRTKQLVKKIGLLEGPFFRSENHTLAEDERGYIRLDLTYSPILSFDEVFLMREARVKYSVVSKMRLNHVSAKVNLKVYDNEAVIDRWSIDIALPSCSEREGELFLPRGRIVSHEQITRVAVELIDIEFNSSVVGCSSL